MTDYGVFANLVATVSSLAAAGGAIVLTFTKRAKWQPPEEAVPAAVSRMAGLVTMVGIALLYVFAARLGTNRLAGITVVALVIALLSLIIAMGTNIKHAYYYPTDRQEANRHLGGDELTPEAASIARKRKRNPQQLFEDSHGDKDLVWTRRSQFSVSVRSTLSFIALIGAGACCIAAAGMLVAGAAAP